MKVWKDTTMPLAKKTNAVRISPEQEDIFNKLIDIVRPYEKWFTLKENKSSRYELWTDHAFRTKSLNPRAKRGVLFVGIAIQKYHVGFYFYPLHVSESFKTKLQNGLDALLYGSSTFHIDSLSDAIIFQLKDLLKEGLLFYYENGWINKEIDVEKLNRTVEANP